MAKVKYDYDGVEEGAGTYDGDDPKPGIYPAKVASAELGKSKAGNPMVTVTIDIVKGEYKGWKGWHYLVLTPESAWKEKEFTDALGLTKPGKKKGTWDTDDAVGKECRVKIKREMYEGEPQGKIKSVLSPKKDSDDDEDDDEPDTGDTPATDEPEDEPDADEEGEEKGDDEEDEAVAERRTELEGMGKPALKKALAATDSEFTVTSKTKTEDLIEAILEAEFADDEEEEDDEEGYDWSDLVDLDRKGLKDLIAEEELDVKVTKKMTDDALRALVAAELGVEPGEPPF